MGWVCSHGRAYRSSAWGGEEGGGGCKRLSFPLRGSGVQTDEICFVISLTRQPRLKFCPQIQHAGAFEQLPEERRRIGTGTR